MGNEPALSPAQVAALPKRRKGPAKPILKGEERLAIAVPPPRSKRARRQRHEGPADPLFEALREARRALATAAAVPPYVVFHDSTLREIAALKPRSLGELARVGGVGEAKLARYGEAMLAAWMIQAKSPMSAGSGWRRSCFTSFTALASASLVSQSGMPREKLS